MMAGERLAALEGLRGYAALLVFFVHAFGLLAARLYGADVERHAVLDDPDVFRAVTVLLARSHYGVDLFFVLSGLLMTDLALRRWPGTGRFLARRWLRIYPPYAVSTIVAAAVAALWLGRAVSPAEAWGNVILLQGFFVLGIPAVNPVTWSLSYEGVFYLSIPVFACAWRSSGRPPRALPLAVAFAAIIAFAALLAFPKAIYFAYFALFVPGILLGALPGPQREQLAAAVPLPAVLATWAAFAVAFKLGALANTGPAYYVFSALAGGLLVLKVCDAKGALARWLSMPAARWMGRHSYSFFLIHYVVVHGWGAAAAILVSTQDRLAYALAFLPPSLALSLAAARLLYALTERFYFERS
jgi:peptidoglycan/LPS O-acetylase OafA/YrhL